MGLLFEQKSGSQSWKEWSVPGRRIGELCLSYDVVREMEKWQHRGSLGDRVVNPTGFGARDTK